MERILIKNPAYGIPRVTEELQDTYEQEINHKVVQRVLKIWDLSLLRSVRPPQPSSVQQAITTAGKRANLVAQIEQIGLFQVAYTDFTELVYANGGRKAYLMPIVAHRCKVAYGWAVGERANTGLALAAWSMAKETFQEYGISSQGMVMHHDQDSVYTGFAWTHQLLLVDGLRLSYALNGCKDNPAMESFHGRFKTENESLFLEATCLPELRAIVTTQMDYYNKDRRHSSLGYLPPLRYMKQMQSKAS